MRSSYGVNLVALLVVSASCQLLLDLGGNESARDANADATADASPASPDGGLKLAFEAVGLAPGFNEGRVKVLPMLVDGPSLGWDESTGRIYVGGRAGVSVDTRVPSSLGVVALESDGRAATGFGESGFIALRRAANTDDALFDMVLDRERRLIVTGDVAAVGGLPFAALARLLGDGGLDPTFGDGGWVITGSIGERAVEARAVATAGESRIVMAGRVQLQSDGEWESLSVRFLPNGDRDPSWKQITKDTGYDNGSLDVSVDDGDRVMLVGATKENPSATNDGVMLRLLSDGGRDFSFGGNGAVKIPLPAGNDAVHGVARAAGGSTFIAGSYGNDSTGFVGLVDESGGFDAGFGDLQRTVIPVARLGSALRAVAVDQQGRAVVAGFITVDGRAHGYVARLDPSGRPDRVFGRGNDARIVASPGADVRLRALTVLPGGDILVAGDVARDERLFRAIVARFAP